MATAVDKLIGKVLLHKHKSSDIDYIEGIILTDPDGGEWLLTVNTDGALVTTVYTTNFGDLLLEDGSGSLLLENGTTNLTMEV